MNHIEEISKYILNKLCDDKVTIIAICGAADLGKSYIAERIVDFLSSKEANSSHLPIDSFLMERSERIIKGISGYDVEAYDIQALKSVLVGFQQGEDISYYNYIHETGKKSKTPASIKSTKCLILDGLHSLNENLLPFINFGIFVYTEDNKLRKIRQDADIVKRKQSVVLSRSLEHIEFDKYKNNVAPYKEYANLHVYLEHKWSYQVIKNTE